MPNWDNVIMAITGDEEELDSLIEYLNSLERDKDDNSIWAGSVFIGKGFVDPDDKNKCSLYCRAWIHNYEKRQDNIGSYVLIDYDSAWNHINDSWRTFFNKCYPSLDFVFIEEECGMEIYTNTDTEGRFFKIRYRLYDYIDDEENWFETEEELLKYINEHFSRTYNSINELESSYEDNDSELYFWNKFDTEE